MLGVLGDTIPFHILSCSLVMNYLASQITVIYEVEDNSLVREDVTYIPNCTVSRTGSQS